MKENFGFVLLGFLSLGILALIVYLIIASVKSKKKLGEELGLLVGKVDEMKRLTIANTTERYRDDDMYEMMERALSNIIMANGSLSEERVIDQRGLSEDDLSWVFPVMAGETLVATFFGEEAERDAELFVLIDKNPLIEILSPYVDDYQKIIGDLQFERIQDILDEIKGLPERKWSSKVVARAEDDLPCVVFNPDLTEEIGLYSSLNPDAISKFLYYLLEKQAAKLSVLDLSEDVKLKELCERTREVMNGFQMEEGFMGPPIF